MKGNLKTTIKEEMMEYLDSNYDDVLIVSIRMTQVATSIYSILMLFKNSSSRLTILPLHVATSIYLKTSLIPKQYWLNS